MADDPYSHVAFSDESRFNVGRFRAVAVLTCALPTADEFRGKVAPIIQNGDLREFKWHKLRQARDRFVAIDLIGRSIDALSLSTIRIDVLIWDTHDSRHLVENRDDNANLHRMYYHLLRNVMRLRWSSDSTWMLYPDEHSAMDWQTLAQIFRHKSFSISQSPKDLLSSTVGYATRLRREFGIHAIQPVKSDQEPLCQIADLFAGIGAYSYSNFERYSMWMRYNDLQLSFEFDTPAAIALSNSERERFPVLKSLSEGCKSRSLGVSLNSSRGLRTHNPSYPINFWKYVPQTEADKAPTK